MTGLSVGVGLWCALGAQEEAGAVDGKWEVTKEEAAWKPDGLFDLGNLEQPPVPTFQARPVYPMELRVAGITGNAIVGFIVDSHGKVRSAYAIRATHPEFGEAGVAAVSQWKFEPGRVGGRVVNTRMQVPLYFNIVPDAPAPAAKAPGMEEEEWKPDGLFDLSDLEQQPVPTSQASPVYPLELREAGIMGNAIVGFIVDKQGKVRSPYAVRATHPEFGEAAVVAVAQWKFEPGQKDGQVVNTRMQVPVIFNLLPDDPGAAARAEARKKLAIALPKVKDSVDAVGASHVPPPELQVKQAPWDVAPQPLKQRKPEYPYAMRRIGDDGTVVLRLLVRKTGVVDQVHVLRSTNPGLDEAAVDAALDWVFSPAIKNGLPIDAELQVPIMFRIDGKKARDRWTISKNLGPWPESVPEVFRWDTAPELVSYAAPVYPRAALMDGRKGKVRVKFAIDEQGRVLTALPAEDGDPDLMQAAIAAVETFRFKPARREWKPCGAILNMEFNFTTNSRSDAPVSRDTIRVLKQLKRGKDRFADLTELDGLPEPLSQRPPKTPPQLLKEGKGGEVLLEVVIDRKGFVRLPKVLEATDPALGAAAIHAVSNWRYAAPLRDGEAVDVVAKLPVVFRVE